jgi:peptide/nickel transport system ATP-binding protein
MAAIARPPRRAGHRGASLGRLVRGSHGYQRAMLLAGAAITAALVVVAVFAPLIAPYGYAQLQNGSGYFGSQQPPSAQHWLGTTVGGYDVLSRVIWGAQTALEVVIAGTVAGLLLGVFLGLVCGFLGGWLDGFLVIITDGLYAFPPLLLAIVMSIVISGGASGRWSGIGSAGATVSVVFIPQYFRVIRAETVRLKQEPFIDAARVAGVPSRRILARHILANSTRSLPLILTLNAGAAVATLAGLGFLGFGIQPTAAAEWGYDLNRAQSDIASGIWWTGLFPGLAIAIAVLGLTLLGEGINDVRDPRLRARRPQRAGRLAPGRPGGETAGETAGRADGTAPLLDIVSLGVTFATDHGVVTAVEDLSLRVGAAEIVAIVGESGSGKTVTARAALRLLPSTSAVTGEVRLAGHDVLSATRRQLRRLRGQDAAMIFQDPGQALNPVYPVGWQITEALRARGHLSRRDARERAVALLDLVGIPQPEQRISHYPHQFSGGQQQRLVIAAALALDPPLLVADEPTTALDVTVQAEILDLLRSLRDVQGRSILLITHNMGVVADLADRVLVMRDGRLVEEDATAGLFARPREEYTRRLLEAVPRLGQRGDSGGEPPGDANRAGAPRRRGARPAGRRERRHGRAAGGGLPGPVPAARLPGRGQRDLPHPSRGSGGPGRRIRLGQDDDRPRHRRPRVPLGRAPASPRPGTDGCRRWVAGGRAPGHRVRVPGSGRVVRPEADHRREHCRAHPGPRPA